MTTDREIARWRLRSQHLTGPHAAGAEDVVRGLLAVQAENASQAAWAVAGRTVRPDAADLAGLLDRGEVIRTHVLRPTWHFAAADDLGWLLDLTAPRVRPTIVRQLGGVPVERAVTVVVDALGAEPDQTRDQLAAHLHDAGLDLSGHQLMVLLGLTELDQLVCSGRPADGTHTYATFASRVPSPRRMEREEALAELALRYFTGHGPATERDLAYWATLSLGDVRTGLAAVRDRLASFEHDGRTFWHAPADPPTPGERAGHLLQILDEIYRGYQDTRMVIDSEGVVPTGRETAIGMALVDGQMVARMKRTLARRVVFELTPYDERLWRAGRADVEAAASRYAAFLGLDYELRVT